MRFGNIASKVTGSEFLQVHTAEGSEPAQSLLAPWNTGQPSKYWRAPLGVSTVELCISLAAPASVSSIVLLVSPCGYTYRDVPVVHKKLHSGSGFQF